MSTRPCDCPCHGMATELLHAFPCCEMPNNQPRWAFQKPKPKQHMKSCSGFVGTLFGHKYEPRYSVEEHTTPKPEFPYGTFFESTVTTKGKQPPVVQDTYKKTYHGDVCPRCGDTINTPEHAKAST